MKKTPLSVVLQNFTPQQALTSLMGRLAACRSPWLKDAFTSWFIKQYNVDMSEAAIEDYRVYETFNDFFIRQLKPGLRPIAPEADGIISPADGAIAQLGAITEDKVLQAKGHYFDLLSLLGGKGELAKTFYNGSFATIYLAPHNYHRVHMPLNGKLIQTIYVPGKLFSVNKVTATHIPQLYSRNERLICIFESEAGRFALIFVGAMIVASIQTAWSNAPVRSNGIKTEDFASPIAFKKGDELGHFKLGSTVILLFEKNRMQWQANLQPDASIQVGRLLGTTHPI